MSALAAEWRKMMVQVKNITKSFGNGDNRTEVLKGISLKVEDGDFVVILGASGSGKSTLLNVMSGLEKPDGGEVLYDGRNIAGLSDACLLYTSPSPRDRG